MCCYDKLYGIFFDLTMYEYPSIIYGKSSIKNVPIGVVAISFIKCTEEKGGVMVKKMLVVLLVCLTACSLCACTTTCCYEGCDKQVEKSKENKSSLSKTNGHLCEEHLAEEKALFEDLESILEE